MPHCPNCALPLRTIRHREGLFFFCDPCQGRAVTLPQARRVAGDKFAAALQRGVNQSAHFTQRPCPFCGGRMRRFFSEKPEIELDACKSCWVIWFDPQEFEAVPGGGVESTDELQMRSAEVIAQHRLDELKSKDAFTEEPDADWKTVPAFFGFPVETDSSTLGRQPWLTFSVSALIVLATVWAWNGVDNWAQRFGMVPAEVGRYGGATFLTSFFLHGNLWHLVGNVYFLLIFGDNVEDYLGRWRWLFLLVAAAMTGNVLHLLAEPHSTVPCIGASGGIAGLLAFYALEFPRARLSFLFARYGWGLLFSGYSFYSWLSIPAWGAFVIWVILQFFLAAQQLAGIGSVSAAAHLGGAVAGFGAWLLWRKLPQPEPELA